MRRCFVALLVPLLAAFGALAGSATGSIPDRQTSHGLVVGPDDGGHLDQHGPTSGHLPPS
jgi:hypothetical protein